MRILILVVAGRNERLRRDLAAQDRRHPTLVLGLMEWIRRNQISTEAIAFSPAPRTLGH